MTYALGVILAYLLGTFLSYWICAFIYSGLLVVLIPFLLFIQESPLRTRHVVNNAKKLLTSLKNKKIGLSSGLAFRSLLLRLSFTNLIYFCHVFMGNNVLLQYVGPILNVAGASEWNIPHGVLVALTVGGGEFIGAILSIITSPRLKHVVSAFIGAVGVCIGHIGIAVYFVLIGGFSPRAVDVKIPQNTSNQSSPGLSMICFFEPTVNGDLGQQYSPLALIGLAVVMIMYGAFWMLQPSVIAVEMFPDGARDLGVGITVAVRCTFQVILSFLPPFLERLVGAAIMFFLFAIIAGATAILVPCIVPETKGRPMGERGDKFTPKQNLKEFFKALKLLCFCKLNE